MVTDDMSYDDFNGCIIKAGKLMALNVKKKCKGWFQFNRDKLAPLIEERNHALHLLRRSSAEPEVVVTQLKQDLRQMQRHIADAVTLAKAAWYGHLCEKNP